jgi:hypothetical protein
MGLLNDIWQAPLVYTGDVKETKETKTTLTQRLKLAGAKAIYTILDPIVDIYNEAKICNFCGCVNTDYRNVFTRRYYRQAAQERSLRFQPGQPTLTEQAKDLANSILDTITEPITAYCDGPVWVQKDRQNRLNCAKAKTISAIKKVRGLDKRTVEREVEKRRAKLSARKVRRLAKQWDLN